MPALGQQAVFAIIFSQRLNFAAVFFDQFGKARGTARGQFDHVGCIDRIIGGKVHCYELWFHPQLKLGSHRRFPPDDCAIDQGTDAATAQPVHKRQPFKAEKGCLYLALGHLKIMGNLSPVIAAQNDNEEEGQKLIARKCALLSQGQFLRQRGLVLLNFACQRRQRHLTQVDQHIEPFKAQTLASQPALGRGFTDAKMGRKLFAGPSTQPEFTAKDGHHHFGSIHNTRKIIK